MKQPLWTNSARDRRYFIGGSDARIIMGDDEAALAPPLAGEARRGRAGGPLRQPHRPARARDRAPQPALVRAQYRADHLNDVQRRVRHPVIRWMAATLDGMVEGTGAVFEAKFMLPWSFSEEAAAEKHMAQLQHNMWVTNAKLRSSRSSPAAANGSRSPSRPTPLYQHLLLTAEKKFWRCVESGEPPRLFGVEPPRPRIEAVRIVDMSSSNAWAEFAGVFRRTRSAFLEHESAKAELKGLMPEDAKEAIGHGIRAKRSKSGAVSFDLLEHGGRQPCSGPVNRLAPSRRRSPRRRPSSPTRRSR